MAIEVVVVLALLQVGMYWLIWRHLYRNSDPDFYQRKIEVCERELGAYRLRAKQWSSGRKRTFYIGGMLVDKDERLRNAERRAQALAQAIKDYRKRKSRAEQRMNAKATTRGRR